MWVHLMSFKFYGGMLTACFLALTSYENVTLLITINVQFTLLLPLNILFERNTF